MRFIAIFGKNGVFNFNGKVVEKFLAKNGWVLDEDDRKSLKKASKAIDSEVKKTS